MTEFKPILASLGRHKLIASLLALLVALTCAIVCNVAFMIQRQDALTSLPSGVAEDQLVLVESANLDRTANQLVRHDTDLAALRMIPGVESAAAVDALPFNGDNWTSSVQTSPDAQAYQLASLFNGTRGELGTLGLKLVAGRDFRADEYIPLDAGRGNEGIRHVATAIITITWFWFFSVVLLLGAQINAINMGLGPWKYDITRVLMEHAADEESMPPMRVKRHRHRSLFFSGIARDSHKVKEAPTHAKADHQSGKGK